MNELLDCPSVCLSSFSTTVLVLFFLVGTFQREQKSRRAISATGLFQISGFFKFFLGWLSTVHYTLTVAYDNTGYGIARSEIQN